MRLLVIRTSAMGDVALTTPVLKGMREQFPEVNIVMLTRDCFKPFFSSIKGLEFFFPDMENRHKGFGGIIRLFNDIKNEIKVDYVIDLHDVLRSKMLRLLFWLSGVPVKVIDKGRSEKRLIITGKSKKKLKHSVERYCDVFRKAGFNVQPFSGKLIEPSHQITLDTQYVLGLKDGMNIGVAPYARHKLKMWPEASMIRLLELISGKHKCRFWLFGGKEDSKDLDTFCSKAPFSINLACKLTLEEELLFMTKLDCMIAMDSSNMHMAALVGIKVISLWGGTDPLGGFSAWMQPDNYSIRIPVNNLTCRPCTIYGKGECKRGDFACMNWLTPETVYQNFLKIMGEEH